MNLKDSRGLPVSTESDAALESYEKAVLETHGYFGNPLESLDAALAEDPDFAMAHALKADLAVMSSEQGALPLIRQGIEAFDRIGDRATARERAHIAAARELKAAGIILFSYDSLIAPPNSMASLTELGRAAFGSGSN